MDEKHTHTHTHTKKKRNQCLSLLFVFSLNQILYHKITQKNGEISPTLSGFGIVFNYVGIIHANKPQSKPQQISKVSGNYYYYGYGMKMNSALLKNKHKMSLKFISAQDELTGSPT